MNLSNSYAYFAFTGENFNPAQITKELEIEPTDSWRTGDQNRYLQQQKFSCWKLNSRSDEFFDMDKLVNEVIGQLSSKIEQINELKERLVLETVLEIVMYVDVNEEQSTPFLGHNLEVIDFLHQTRTTTDIDIYRFNTEK